LKDLDFFPYVVVVPPGSGNQLGEGETAILPLRSLAQWLDRETSKRLAATATPVLSSLEMTLELGSDPALGRAVVNVRVDGPGATWVTLGLGEVALRRARAREWVATSSEVGGIKRSEAWTPMIRRSASGHEVRMERAGNYEIEVEYMADVSRLPSDRTLKLTPPSAPVSQIRLECSEGFAFVRDQATGLDVPLSPEGTSAELAVSTGESLSIAWRKKSDSLPRPSAMSLRTTVEVRIEPSTTQIESILDVEPAGELAEATLRFSPDDQNIQILPMHNDQPLAHDIEWSDTDGARQCVVRLARAVSGPVRWKLMYQRGTVLGPSGIDLSVPEWVGTPSPPSLMLLWWSPNLWVRVRPGPSARRVNVADLTGDFRESPPRQAFRFVDSSATVTVTAESARPVMTASAQSDLLVGRDAQLTTRFALAVRGAQADSFVFVVPQRMRNVEVIPSDLLRLEDLEIDPESPTRQIRAVLAEVIEDKEIEVTLRGEIPLDMAATNQIRLPSIDSDRFAQGTLTVRVEPGRRLVLNDAGTEYLRREPIPVADVIDPPAYWYFRRQPGEASLSFHIESLPATIDSNVESTFVRTESEIEVRTLIRFQARHAPFDELSVAVPPTLAAVQVSSDLLVDNVPWKPGAVVPLRLRNPAGECEIQFDYRVPVPAESSGTITVPLVLPRGTTLETWSGRVFSERGLRAAVGTGWVATLPAPSRVVESGRRAVADVRPAELSSVSDQLPIRFEPTALLATLVVPRVAIEEIVTPEGNRWVRKRWLIAKHRVRDVSIRLPEGARRLNTFVDGQPAEDTPVGDRVIQVRLPAVDAPTSLELEYDFPKSRHRGAISLEKVVSPVLLEDAAIEEVRWTFRMLDDRLLFRWGSAGSLLTIARLGLSQAEPNYAEPGVDDLKWMESSGYNLVWAPRTRELAAPRIWLFSLFNNDQSLELMSVREPFWILACSGGCLVLILALSRLTLAYQLRVALVAFVVLMALMALVPEAVTWFWVGARWGIGLGLIAAMIHWLIALRRQRGPIVASRRPTRSAPLGSSILKQLEPKTRISTRAPRRDG
jgi:hypothetical protein